MSTEIRHRASLLFSVVLAVVAAVLVLHRPEAAPAAPVRTKADAPAVMPTMASQLQRPQYPNFAPVPDQRRWLIDQMRAMGVPNKVLARVALEDLEKRQNQYATEVSKQCYGDPATLAALQVQFDRNLDREMRAALGDGGFKQWDRENMLREADSGKVQLTASESDAVYDLWKKLQEQQLNLEQAKVDGTMDPADISDALDKAASDFNQQMKGLLGDDRYAKSQQLGNAAAGLQQDLASVSPSDSQFQQLLKAQEQWNDQQSALEKQYQNDPSSPDYVAQLKALNDAREQTYRQVLGADAFSALQKGQDPGYNEMKKHETLWGLDDDKINSVYETLKYYNKAAQDYQQQVSNLQAQGQNVDWDAANRNLQQFASQTGQSLQDYLGENSFNKMQQNGVFNLSPPTLPLMHSKP